MSLLKRLEQGQPGNSHAAENSTYQAPAGTQKLGTVSCRVVPPGASAQRDTYLDLKSRVQNRLLSEIDPAMDISRINDVRATIQELFDQILGEENIVRLAPEECACSSK